MYVGTDILITRKKRVLSRIGDKQQGKRLEGEAERIERRVGESEWQLFQSGAPRREPSGMRSKALRWTKIQINPSVVLFLRCNLNCRSFI